MLCSLQPLPIKRSYNLTTRIHRWYCSLNSGYDKLFSRPRKSFSNSVLHFETLMTLLTLKSTLRTAKPADGLLKDSRQQFFISPRHIFQSHTNATTHPTDVAIWVNSFLERQINPRPLHSFAEYKIEVFYIGTVFTQFVDLLRSTLTLQNNPFPT